jgi:hypothetical protein
MPQKLFVNSIFFTPSQAVELWFAKNLQSARKMQNDFFNRVAKTKF